MIRFGKAVVKYRIPLLIVSVLLLIPAALGYFSTRVNYDILSYLPGEIETMKGQDILLEEFETGAFSFILIEDMQDKEIEAMADQIEEIDHVKQVIWYGSVADYSIPREMLPEDIYNFFNNADSGSQLMLVLYDDSMASDGTMAAIDSMNAIVGENALISGMASVINDIRLLAEEETPVYVGIAVLLSLIVLSLTMDSFVIPLLFLASIGMAIVYNLGTNIIQGEISYVTQALAAVLQLAVTMDYSIFLWHSYEDEQTNYKGDKKKAMAHAIANTITSIVGSSVTTIAGFVALCFMSFTLGMDLGVVMAKGVVFGVIGCVTILPAMILVFDGLIEKTRHRAILPDMGFIAGWVTDHFVIFLALFLLILGPAIYGYTHTQVYYDLAGSLPDTLSSRQANMKLDEDYNMGATHIILAPSDMSKHDSINMIEKMRDVDGVKLAVSLDSLLGAAIPEEFLPDTIVEVMKSGDYQMMLVTSEYTIASDEVNNQIDELNAIAKSYDESIMVIGEAPCTKDLIEITATDFATVSAVSILAIFAIIALVFKSISLPFILVMVIEFGIFVNMGIPAYTGSILPFIASIVIGTIQLGATVDYAILMTNKYKVNRYNGIEKKPAIKAALRDSVQSVCVSAITFFAATFGVGMYSNIDMIGSLCMLMARGALISMLVVIFLLPSMFMIFDKLIVATSVGFKKKEKA